MAARNPKANGCLTEMPAAAKLAAAEAADMPAASAAAEAAYVAKVCAGEMTAAEATHVTDVSAGEMTTAVETEAPVEAGVKAVVETGASDEDRTTIPVIIVVIRIGVAVTEVAPFI
jgi:hypothetical protein